ncbi:hypothetical protein Daus18300_013261 [Diaporthe australafricana]|uniref:Uncharacterized protein n=1 Tax=Diaporthe australafricana TaxID=127596 RepID=A0ABR3VZQ5_9PEZI
MIARPQSTKAWPFVIYTPECIEAGKADLEKDFSSFFEDEDPIAARSPERLDAPEELNAGKSAPEELNAGKRKEYYDQGPDMHQENGLDSNAEAESETDDSTGAYCRATKKVWSDEANFKLADSPLCTPNGTDSRASKKVRFSLDTTEPVGLAPGSNGSGKKASRSPVAKDSPTSWSCKKASRSPIANDSPTKKKPRHSPRGKGSDVAKPGPDQTYTKRLREPSQRKPSRRKS